MEFAAQLRSQHKAAAEIPRGAAAVLRDCETQLQRLMPLRAQYADDLLKLGMLGEAQQIFDPLSVTTCPACLNRLSAPPPPATDAAAYAVTNWTHRREHWFWVLPTLAARPGTARRM
ncbi:hypothetical protein ABZ093_02880 [Streptomyces cyaneofuscatus]|uniref:hypothetical protein n=1 Tax=Streptomyces cyaneofuscatus TaxID=66883 RepID=UPI0033BC74A2